MQSPFSPDEEYCDKKGTLERKTNREKLFDTAVPHTELLDTSAAKAKAELANKGSLANRQPPSIKKMSSFDVVRFRIIFLKVFYKIVLCNSNYYFELFLVSRESASV